jgi:phage shock protein A
MGLLERIKNVVRSNLSDFLDRAEDPDKMIGLLIEDMETNLRQARAQIAQMTGEKGHFQRRYRELADQIEKWEGKARIALNFGNESLAREALVKKLDLDERAGRLRGQIGDVQRTIDDLRLNTDSLQSKIDNARQKRQELRLQQKREQALRAINRSHDAIRRAGLNADAIARGESIDEAILRAQSGAESAEELRRTLYENRFEQLQQTGKIDQAMEELKRRMTVEHKDQPGSDGPDTGEHP